MDVLTDSESMRLGSESITGDDRGVDIGDETASDNDEYPDKVDSAETDRKIARDIMRMLESVSGYIKHRKDRRYLACTGGEAERQVLGLKIKLCPLVHSLTR